MNRSIAKKPFNSKEEREKFRTSIYTILVRIGMVDDTTTKAPDGMTNALLDSYLDDTAIDEYWVPAFSDTSAGFGYDFETVEWYGDAVCGYVFVDYLYNRFPGQVKQKSGTILKSFYMSKTYQAKLAQEFGLDKLVFRDSNIKVLSVDFLSDIFESFIGTMAQIGNKRIAPMVGTGLVSKCFRYIFDREKIDVQSAEYESSIMKLKELFAKIGWGNDATYKFEGSDMSGVNMKAVVYDPLVPGAVLGVGYGMQDVAKGMAASNALKELESRGITLDTAEEIQQSRKRIDNPEYDQACQKLEQYIKERNDRAEAKNEAKIVNYRFNKATVMDGATGKKIYTVSLVFIMDLDDNRTNKIMETMNFDRDAFNNQTKVINSFLDKQSKTTTLKAVKGRKATGK